MPLHVTALAKGFSLNTVQKLACSSKSLHPRLAVMRLTFIMGDQGSGGGQEVDEQNIRLWRCGGHRRASGKVMLEQRV